MRLLAAEQVGGKHVGLSFQLDVLEELLWQVDAHIGIRLVEIGYYEHHLTLQRAGEDVLAVQM